ncbi:MAG TPA: LUD domain-containing protein [Gaiellaceae bacterium]|jgi:L-lactate dehydrogenase complex protein LldG
MVEQALTTARDEILARIRAVDRSAPEPIERRYRRSGSLARAALVELFAARVADYRADVRLVPSGAVAGAVESVCRGRVSVPPGLPDAWRPSTVDVVEDRGLSAHKLDALDGVITGCTAAIAETGTIILSGGESEGRRALSLVPDLHICVVRSDQIVELVPEALAVLDPGRPLTFISGPSATSDIELSRIEGVHGPRTLVVLIVNEEEQ